jgi:hypothetical protein
MLFPEKPTVSRILPSGGVAKNVNRLQKNSATVPFDGAQGRLRDGRTHVRPPQDERKESIRSTSVPFGLRRLQRSWSLLEADPEHRRVVHQPGRT